MSQLYIKTTTRCKHIHEWYKYCKEHKDVYIEPIVDYEKERKVALTLFKQKK